MQELPVFELARDDPQNNLSIPARQRIAKARLQSEAIRWEAESTIDAKRLDSHGAEAAFERNQANLAAARNVLAVTLKEYQRCDITLREVWAAMKLEVESIANSLELLDSQRRLLDVEFFATETEPKIEIATEGEPKSKIPKPRGPRLKITVAMMKKALAMKAAGATNREIAVFLDPTNPRRESIPTRLARFRKRLNVQGRG